MGGQKQRFAPPPPPKLMPEGSKGKGHALAAGELVLLQLLPQGKVFLPKTRVLQAHPETKGTKQTQQHLRQLLTHRQQTTSERAGSLHLPRKGSPVTLFSFHPCFSLTFPPCLLLLAPAHQHQPPVSLCAAGSR